MGRREHSFPVGVAVLVSLLLHASGFLLSATGYATAILGGAPESPASQPEPLESEEVVLGLAAPNPSSMTWIGYETYEEHLARLSEVEQAAFLDQPSSGRASVAEGPAPPEESAPEATEPSEATEPAEAVVLEPPSPTETATTASTAPEEVTEPEEGPPPVPISAPTTEPEPVALSIPIELPVTSATREAPIGETIAELTAALIDEYVIALGTRAEERVSEEAVRDAQGEKEPLDAEQMGPEVPVEEDAANPPPATPSRSSPPSARGAPSTQPLAPGDDSDRESDPTSRVDVSPDQWKSNKPLAAHGLDIKTRRPVFPELTRLTATPANPVVEIHFDRTGVPRRVVLLRSSGDSRVDGPVLDSVYRWRASGERLSRLGEGEVVRLEMRIMLVGG